LVFAQENLPVLAIPMVRHAEAFTKNHFQLLRRMVALGWIPVAYPATDLFSFRSSSGA